MKRQDIGCYRCEIDAQRIPFDAFDAMEVRVSWSCPVVVWSRLDLYGAGCRRIASTVCGDLIYGEGLTAPVIYGYSPTAAVRQSGNAVGFDMAASAQGTGAYQYRTACPSTFPSPIFPLAVSRDLAVNRKGVPHIQADRATSGGPASVPCPSTGTKVARSERRAVGRGAVATPSPPVTRSVIGAVHCSGSVAYDGRWLTARFVS